MKKIFLLFAILLVLVACQPQTSKKVSEPVINENSNQEIDAPEEIKTISLTEFNNNVFKKVYKSGSLKPQIVYTHETEHINSSEYDIYDSPNTLGIFFKEGSYIKSSEDFNNFVNSYTVKMFNIFEQKTRGVPSEDYEFVPGSKLEESGYPEIIKFMMWSKVYEVNEGYAYTYKKLDVPIGKAFVIVNCAPNIILFVYPNSYSDIGEVWSNLEEEEYMNSLMSSLKTNHNDAFAEAEEMLLLCKEILS